MLVKKLVRHGNSLAIVLPRPILELLGWSDKQEVRITTPDGKSLKIEAVKTGREEK